MTYLVHLFNTIWVIISSKNILMLELLNIHYLLIYLLCLMEPVFHWGFHFVTILVVQ